MRPSNMHAMLRSIIAVLMLVSYSTHLGAQPGSCISGSGRKLSWAGGPDSLLHLAANKGFFLGETHTWETEPIVKLELIRHLHQAYGVRHIFMEIGQSYAWLMNRYLQTADSTLINALYYWPRNYRRFWAELYAYNLELAPERKLIIHGLDFERKDAFRTLLLLRPAGKSPSPDLVAFFSRLEAAATDTGIADFTPGFTLAFRSVRDEFRRLRQELAGFYGENFSIAAGIMENDNQQMGWRTRNRRMGAGMRRIIEAEGIDRFAGFFGGTHLNYDQHSSMVRQIDATPAFKNKTVYIASLYRFPERLRRGSGGEFLGLAGNRDNDGLFKQLLPQGCSAALVSSSASGEQNIGKRCDWILMVTEE